VASPKFGPWWVLWVCVCLWLVHGPKVHKKCFNYALINLLFGLCILIWIIDLLVNLCNPHPKAPTRPFCPKSVMNEGTYSNSFFFRCFHFRIHIWVFQGLWGASLKSKQKITLENIEHTMRSPMRRNEKTYELNPSQITWSKSCKEVGEKLGRTPSLEEASLIAIIACCKIMMTWTF